MRCAPRSTCGATARTRTATALDDLLTATRRTRLHRRRPRYSNLGFMLLGHALAAAAGTTYAALLRDRVTEPLGMAATTVPASPRELGRVRAPGAPVAAAPWRRGRGRRSDRRAASARPPRTSGASCRVCSTARAPGAAALDPVARFSGPLRIGAAWLTLDRRGTQLTWHDGGTGGFRSVVVLDRAAGAGVALVSACARSVDRAGFRPARGGRREGRLGSGDGGTH